MNVFRVIYHGLVLSRGTFSTINALRDMATDTPYEALKELRVIARHCTAAMGATKLDQDRYLLLRDILQDVTDAINEVEVGYCK